MPAPRRGVAGDECRELLFLGLALIDELCPLEGLQRSLVLLQVVLEAPQPRGRADRHVLVRLSGLFEDPDELLAVSDRLRKIERLRFANLVRELVPKGLARITDRHHQVARVDVRRRDLEEVLRPVGHVFFGEVGGFAVGRDVRAQETEVAGVSRPHPVVHFTAVVADPARRRVDQANVADLELLDPPVLRPLEKGRDRAAHAAFPLAVAHELLAAALDPRIPLEVRQLFPRAPKNLIGDVLDRRRHPDARVGRGGDLLTRGSGEESALDEVLLRRRVVLQIAVDAVMVGDDQPLRRDERRAAAAERDDRPHRIAGQVGEPGGVELQPHFRELRRELRDLLRHPHSFAGEQRGGDRGREHAHPHCFRFHGSLPRPRRRSRHSIQPFSAPRKERNLRPAGSSPRFGG